MKETLGRGPIADYLFAAVILKFGNTFRVSFLMGIYRVSVTS